MVYFLKILYLNMCWNSVY